ncbi:unnamed protein product [Trichobilharzia regenti]|nr:unnamed protein product [Trichobilharzia regenti]
MRRRSVFFAREIKHNIVQLDKVNEEMKKLALHLSSSSSKSSQLKSVESINNANKAIKEIKEQLLDISLYLQVDVDGLGRVDHALEFQIIGLNDLSMKLKNEFNKLQVGWYSLVCYLYLVLLLVFKCFITGGISLIVTGKLLGSNPLSYGWRHV